MFVALVGVLVERVAPYECGEVPEDGVDVRVAAKSYQGVDHPLGLCLIVR
jgi:hypothetical protein